MNAVLNAALPIFALICTGYLCARYWGFDRVATDNLNRFAIYLALPALMFVAMSKITPVQLHQFGFAAAFLLGIAVTFALGFALSRWQGRGAANASIEALDAAYSNVGFMGIPLALLTFGPDSLPPAIITTLFTACLLFLFAIVLIEIDLNKDARLSRTLRKVAVSLLRNPLLIAPVTGLCVGLVGVPLPGPVDRFATLLGGAASPCALVCIGLFLGQERVIGDDMRTIATLVFLKLIVQPGLTALLAIYVFDMPPLWARVAILLAALPIGSGPFTIAKLYRLEAATTSGAILASHIFSVMTVAILVAWLT